MVTRYTDEERQRIYDEARAAIEAAEETLAEPRPAGAELPPCETRSQRWRREAAEQEERFARERAASQPLTEWQAAQLEHRLAGLVEQEKRFVLDVLAEIIAEERHAFEAKIAELSAEIGQLRADQTVHRALAKGEPGDVIDLPALPLRRRVA